MPAGRPERGIEVADADTFDAFYRGSNQRLYDCVYAITGNRSEAQDAVHEAYARAWQRWNTVGDYADPEAWVRTVARRVAVSRWRRTRSALLAHRRPGPPPASAGHPAGHDAAGGLQCLTVSPPPSTRSGDNVRRSRSPGRRRSAAGVASGRYARPWPRVSP